MAIPKIKEDYKYTYADYLTWDDDERWEIIQGVPYCMSPAPTPNHQKIAGALFNSFYNYLEDKPCDVYIAPLDVILPGTAEETNEEITTVVQPDIVVVCDETKLDDRGCKGAPDLVIEILSPHTSGRDIKEKFFLYEKHGVKEYWIVDPSNKIVTVYKTGTDNRYARADNYAKDDKINVGIIKDFTVDLAKVFK